MKTNAASHRNFSAMLALMTTLRRAQKSDAQKIEKLVNSAYRGDYSKQGWTTEADLLDGQRTDEGKLLEMIESKDSRIELLLEDDRLLGCVYLNLEAGALYLGMLTVEPTLQDKGYGKVLLQRAEDVAREMGMTEIRMTVINNRPELMAYYERRGYKPTGKTEPFPENDPRFGLPKTKLVFHEFSKKLK